MTSPKADDEIVQQKGLVKFNKRPADHDQWKCTSCRRWTSVRNKACDYCRRQHGGERVETRNGSAMLISMIKSIENALQELSQGEDFLYYDPRSPIIETLEKQRDHLNRVLRMLT